MTDQAPFRFIVAGEDNAHLRACRAVMRQVLERDAEKLRGVLVDECWTFELLTTAFSRVKAKFPNRFGSPLHGFGRGPDHEMIRAQLLLWAANEWDFDAAVVVRDTDRTDARKDSATNARKDVTPTPKPLLLAHAEPGIESWFIAGFEPTNDDERARVEDSAVPLDGSSDLGPRLSSTNRSAPDDAKRVLRQLTGGSRARQDECLSCDLERWLRRAGGTGLREFVEECERDLVPSVSKPESE